MERPEPIVPVLVLCLAGASLLAPQAAAASGACAKAVDGKIAWNYKGSKRWRATRVRNLCEGAASSTQPARCFERVMHSGKVNWGGGTRWNPNNALKLCQGTVDADARIRCFQDSISKKQSWQLAIERCRSVATAKSGTVKSAGGSAKATRPKISLDAKVVAGKSAGTSGKASSSQVDLDPKIVSALAEAARDTRCEDNPDADGDGHAAVKCGGDDCDDGDRNRYPGNPEQCDAGGHDEDCNPDTLAYDVLGSFRPAGVSQDGDEDGDGLISKQCCNRQADGSMECGLDPDDHNPALRPGAQRCRNASTVEIVAGGTERCAGRCVTQPNGTGVCLPAR